MWTFLITLFAMCLFAAGTQGWFLTRNRFYESILLVLVFFSLVRPGFWMDRLVPPYRQADPADLQAVVAELPPNQPLRLRVEYETLEGDIEQRVVLLPLGASENPAERLQRTGLALTEQDGRVIVDRVGFGSPAEKAGLDFDQVILAVEVPMDQPPRELIYIPALLMLGLVVVLQLKRRSLSMTS